MTPEQMHQLDDRDRAQGAASHQHGFVGFKVDKAWTQCSSTDLRDILTCRHQGTPELHEPTDQELRLWREFGLLPGGRSKTKCGMSDFDIEDGDVHESSSVHLDTWL